MNQTRVMPVIAVEGIDGSGKSQTTDHAVRLLSQSYPGRIIRVIDSQGTRSYAGSLVIEDRHPWLERVEHTNVLGKMGRLASLGLFTLGRRAMERRARFEDADLVVTVRDSLRIDPAAYAPVLGPRLLGRMSANDRLRLLDRFTRTAPVDHVVHLHTDIAQVLAGLAVREVHDEHETADNLAVLEDSLANVIDAHQVLYGTHASDVEGLLPTSVDEVAAAIEPHLAGAALKQAA